MKFFSGPSMMIHTDFKFPAMILWKTQKDPILEKIHPDTVFWESTGNYLFLQDAKY